jgi:hypothetical protein
MTDGKHVYKETERRWPDGDMAALIRVAHRIQGTAANIGIQVTGAAVRQREQRAHTGGAEQIASACATLEAEPGHLAAIVCTLAKEVVL